MLKSSLIKLHAAATIFASRDGKCSAQDIADILDMPRNSVYHLAKMPEWIETLKTLGYTGEVTFMGEKRGRKAIGDEPSVVDRARDIYIEARRKGARHSRAVNAVLEALPLMVKDRRTINSWAKRYEWESEI